MSIEKRYGLQVVMASWIAVFCLFGIRASFALLLNPIARSTGWTQTQVTFGYSLMMIIYAITAFFCGVIVDKWGSKPVYLIAAIASGTGLIFSGLMRNYFVYILAFSLMNGIATGMLWVTSTISVRKWFIGKQYATKWGFAFAGAPVAQFILSYIIRHILVNDPENGWRTAFIVLAVISVSLLMIAVICAKREPEHYNFKAFGEIENDDKDEIIWSLGRAFLRYAIWGAIFVFLTSMMAEFLIWTQIVSFWVKDIGWSKSQAAHVYAIIGLIGIFSMPAMGYFADYMVKFLKNEAKARKCMLILGPFIGFLACILLLQSIHSILFPYLACILFAFYWAIVPGGVVGYIGSLYGKKTLGKIWGLATLIVMGIGPFLGSFIGGYLKDLTGHFTYSLYFAAISFLISVILAFTLPIDLKIDGLAKSPKTGSENLED